MNKFFLSLIFIFGTEFIISQNIFDALRYSNDKVEGSARFSAMSGAFGALGGELSAVSINPAGSAIFSKGIASFTVSNYKTSNDSDLVSLYSGFHLSGPHSVSFGNSVRLGILTSSIVHSF